MSLSGTSRRLWGALGLSHWRTILVLRKTRFLAPPLCYFCEKMDFWKLSDLFQNRSTHRCVAGLIKKLNLPAKKDFVRLKLFAAPRVLAWLIRRLASRSSSIRLAVCCFANSSIFLAQLTGALLKRREARKFRKKKHHLRATKYSQGFRKSCEPKLFSKPAQKAPERLTGASERAKKKFSKDTRKTPESARNGSELAKIRFFEKKKLFVMKKKFG